jgi:anti-sigma factor RsiW
MNTLEEHPHGALHAYFDGELSLEGSLAVEEHLARCADCSRELETFRALRRLLKSARDEAPEVEPALAKVRALRVVRRRRVWAGAAAMALAASVAVFLAVPSSGSGIVREVAAVHARALETGRSVELASDDPAAIASWLGARVPQPVAPVRGGDGFSLRGARVESLDGRTVSTVVYQVRGHMVDVFAWPSSEGDSEPRPSVAGRWTVCRWAHRGVAYWMVSDAGTDDLKALAALIKDRQA